MMSTLFACISIAFFADGPVVNESQFAQLMKTLHSPIRDITLVYEGESRYIGPPSNIKGKKDSLNRNYQGFYAFRSDGATLLDVYDRFSSQNDLKRETSAMLKWKIERFGQYADRKNAFGRKITLNGDPGSFFTDGTPERILYSWYFNFLAKPMGYRSWRHGI